MKSRRRDVPATGRTVTEAEAERAPRLAVGTCGYSYADWVGPFYPPGTKPAQMLERYARRFAAVEVDASYYRVPSLATFASLARRTPERFRFSVKLPSAGTHLPAGAAGVVADDVLALRRNVEPLIDAGKLACVLAQFPNAFHPTPATRTYLRRLRETLDDVALVVEFRHRSWQNDETLALLTALDVGLVNVDEPHFATLLRPGSDATSEIAYVRFHGRNASNWWRGTNATRYDYLYGPDELEPWLDRIGDLTSSPRVRDVFAFFNNHRQGNAVRNAEMFEAMLEQRGFAVDRPEPKAGESGDAAMSLPLDFGGDATG